MVLNLKFWIYGLEFKFLDGPFIVQSLSFYLKIKKERFEAFFGIEASLANSKGSVSLHVFVCLSLSLL